MYVWDSPPTKHVFFMSSVPYFDNNCGQVVKSFQEFVSNFDDFYNKLETYNPKNFVLEKLTYEKFIKDIFYHFENF